LSKTRRKKLLMIRTITSLGQVIPKVQTLGFLFGALLLPTALVARPAAAQITGQLTMQSEPGDYIGGGQTYAYDFSNSVFTAQAYDYSGDGQADYVTISFHALDWSHWWYLSFSTNQLGLPLVPGYYPNAERAPFASPGHPGLDVSGDGRGSNSLTGQFSIQDVAFDYSTGQPRVVRFQASFEQHSEGMTPALTGSISFVDASDLSIPVTTASLSGPLGNDNWYTGPVKISLSATDATGEGDVVATYYSVDSGPVQTYSGPFTVAADGSHTLAFWSVDRAGNQESPRYQPFKIDVTAPAITASAVMQLLRTQKGYTAMTTVSGRIADALSSVAADSVSYAVTDEYGLDQPSGPVTLQADGSYSFVVLLDASRNNNDKDGRSYQITIKARDGAGNRGSQSAAVIVPRR